MVALHKYTYEGFAVNTDTGEIDLRGHAKDWSYIDDLDVLQRDFSEGLLHGKDDSLFVAYDDLRVGKEIEDHIYIPVRRLSTYAKRIKGNGILMGIYKNKKGQLFGRVCLDGGYGDELRRIT